MRATGHAISWIYGEFRIARFVRGNLVEQYAPDYLVETQADFVRALREAKKHIRLNSRGKVSVVHEHDSHVHSFLEIPAMRKRDLLRFLQRKVSQEFNSNDEVAWCYHEAKHKDGSNGILLHLLPKRVVDTTIVTCNAMGLVPKRYVPLTEIISAYLPTLHYESDDVILVIALFNERAEIIVTTGDGEVFFVRELGVGTQSSLQTRLSLDINRTVRYTKQQTGKIIREARILGARPDDILESLNDVSKIEVVLDEGSEDPNFWLNQAAHLPANLSANFISRFAQRNITKESIRRAGVWLTLGLLISASVVTASVDNAAKANKKALTEQKLESDQLDDRIGVLQSRMELVKKKGVRLKRLRSNSQNMPGIFLVHLSGLTPDDVILKYVGIESIDARWGVTMRGISMGDPMGKLSSVARTLAGFESALSSDPWNMTISKSWKQSWLKQLQSGTIRDGEPVVFEIEGTLQ